VAELDEHGDEDGDEGDAVPVTPSTVKVHAQFVQVGERRVFVRHAGRGPALVVLHQSPQSSASMQPWFERFAATHAVFAPDTPGFGRSDPLPRAQPTVPDFAQALGELLQALGLQRVLLYGVHSGAAIAARLALDQPQRVAGLVCDGLSGFTVDERQPLLDGYLPPFEPSFDGGHLLWLWARVREQYLFFPWHHGTAAARILYPAMPAAALHADVMDLLDAGDGYRAGYRAPLLYEHSHASAAKLQVPTRLLYRAADVLRPHMDRLPPLPAQVQAHEVADTAAMVQAMQQFYAEQATAASVVKAQEQLALGLATGHRRVPMPQGDLAFLLRDKPRQPENNNNASTNVSASDGPNDTANDSTNDDISAATALAAGPVVELFIPDIGTPAAWPARARSDAHAWVLEWPGHGASERRALQHLSMDVLAAGLVSALPLGPVYLHASAGGCALAAVLAHLLGPRCAGLHLHEPMPLTTDEAALFLASLPEPEPVATGAHLLAAWNWARHKHLFCPWLPPDAQAALRVAAPPPRSVHADVVEMLRAGPCLKPLWQAALAVNLPALLKELGCPVTLSAGHSLHSQRLSQRLLARFAPKKSD